MVPEKKHDGARKWCPENTVPGNGARTKRMMVPGNGARKKGGTCIEEINENVVVPEK